MNSIFIYFIDGKFCLSLVSKIYKEGYNSSIIKNTRIKIIIFKYKELRPILIENWGLKHVLPKTKKNQMNDWRFGHC